MRQPCAFKQFGLGHLAKLGGIAAHYPGHVYERQQCLLLFGRAAHGIKCLMQSLLMIGSFGCQPYVGDLAGGVAFHELFRDYHGAFVKHARGRGAYIAEAGGALYLGHAHALACVVEGLVYHGLPLRKRCLRVRQIVAVDLEKCLALHLQPGRKGGAKHIAGRTQIIFAYPLPELKLRTAQDRLFVERGYY